MFRCNFWYFCMSISCFTSTFWVKRTFIKRHHFFDLTSFNRLGQKYKNIYVRFLVQMKTLKFAFIIYWPLEGKIQMEVDVYSIVLGISFSDLIICQVLNFEYQKIPIIGQYYFLTNKKSIVSVKHKHQHIHNK